MAIRSGAAQGLQLRKHMTQKALRGRASWQVAPRPWAARRHASVKGEGGAGGGRGGRKAGRKRSTPSQPHAQKGGGEW